VESTTGQPSADLDLSLLDLENNLLENSADFDFFQAYRILTRLNRDLAGIEGHERDISVRPNLSLGYANTDIETIERSEHGYEIISNLAGLYGISSPLPGFYTEELLDNEWEGIDGPREFLDLVQNQLLSKLYDAWLLHKLGHNTVENKQQAYWNLIGALTNNDAIKEDPNSELGQIKLMFGGLFTLYSRSSVALKVLLKSILAVDDIEVREFEQSRSTIPESSRFKLGERNNILGDDAHVGSTIADRNGTVVIGVGPITEQQYTDIFKDESKLALYGRLIKDLVVVPLVLKFEVKVLPDNPGMVLGDRWNTLGETSYLAGVNQEEPNIISLAI